MRTNSSFSPMLLFAISCIVLCLAGMRAHVEQYITPETGLGYMLGIIGGSLMLLLLLYPARKRVAWLAPFGSVAVWFKIHMVLGIVGPVLILFHATFKTGAPNSNVALVCMLVVSGSGLIGRYFYSRVHASFYGSQNTLVELRGQLARMQAVNPVLGALPDFAGQLAQCEASMTQSLARTPSSLRLLLAPLAAWRTRGAMRRHVQAGMLRYAMQANRLPSSLRREAAAANQLARRHIDVVRRVSELGTYERLLALWHLLHLPLFFMLLVAGIVHVVAVHLY